MPTIFEINKYWNLPEEAVNILVANMNPRQLAADEISRKFTRLMIRGGTEKPIWASVCLDKPYRIFGHIAESRPDRLCLAMADFSYELAQPLSDTNRPLAGFIHFMSKDVAKVMAGKSPLFDAAWNLLKDLDEKKQWLCFCDPLPDDWVTEMEKKDDETLTRIIEFHKNWTPNLTYDEEAWNDIRSALMKENLADALRLSTALSEKYPSSVHASLGLGLAYQYMDMTDLALVNFRKAIAFRDLARADNSKPPNKVYYPEMGNRMYKLMMKLAMQEIEETFAASWAAENIGDILLKLGETDEAIASWQQSVDIYSGADAATKLGRYFIDSGQYDKAKVVCVKRSIEHPLDDKNWILLGKIFQEKRARREAVDAFSKGYQLNVSSAEANYYLGMSLVHYAFSEHSEPFKDRQLKFPFDATPLYARGVYHLKYCIRNGTPPPYAWCLLGMGYFGTGKYPLAVNAFTEFLKQEPEAAGGWNNLAFAYSLCGDYENAMNASEKALKLEPDDANAIDTMGLIQLRKGNVREALDSFNKAVNLDPKNVAVYCNLAETYTKMGEPHKATDNYRIAKYLAPVKTWQWTIDHPGLASAVQKDTSSNNQMMV